MKPTGPFLEVLSGPGDQDAEVEQVLGAARVWAEPSRENRERVAAALRGALPGLPAAGGLSPALSPGLVAAPGARLPRARRAARGGGASRGIKGGARNGALGFWLGHGAGYAAGQREVVARAGEALASGSEAAPEMESPAPERAVNAESPLERPLLERPLLDGAPASPESTHPESAHPKSALPTERATPTSTAPARVRRAAPPARAGGSAPSGEHAGVAEPPRLSFRQVLDQLRRAQQQLRNGQATMSLLLLSELDRAAGDVLSEERDATRVLALCAAGQDEAARDVARRLEQNSPRSIYGMRLETSCVSELSE
jgi:hypothetical protein